MSYYRIKQLSIILRKRKVMPPPAQHFYCIANEMPVPNNEFLRLYLFYSKVKFEESFFIAQYQSMRLKAKDRLKAFQVIAKRNLNDVINFIYLYET